MQNLWSVDFDKSAKTIQWRKLFSKICAEINGEPHAKETLLYIKCKISPKWIKKSKTSASKDTTENVKRQWSDVVKMMTRPFQISVSLLRTPTSNYLL